MVWECVPHAVRGDDQQLLVGGARERHHVGVAGEARGALRADAPQRAGDRVQAVEALFIVDARRGGDEAPCSLDPGPLAVVRWPVHACQELGCTTTAVMVMYSDTSGQL